MRNLWWYRAEARREKRAMNTGCPDALWVRVRAGKPVCWIGAGVVRCLPPEWKVLRLNCGVAWSMGGPLHRAYQQMRAWLGEQVALYPTEEDSVRVSLLEEMPLQMLEPLLIKSSQQLAERFAGRMLIWFDAVERADQGVLSALRRMLLAKDPLALPWVLSFHEEPQAEVAGFLAQVSERWGEEVRIEGQGEGYVSPERFGWEQLPAPILRVLRAGALVGSSFEVDAAGYLVGKSNQDVLMSLQEAVDLGAPLVDYGDGHLFLPPKAVERLLGSMLPSLRALWHEKLTVWLAGDLVQTTKTPPKADLSSVASASFESPAPHSTHEGALPETTETNLVPFSLERQQAEEAQREGARIVVKRSEDSPISSSQDHKRKIHREQERVVSSPSNGSQDTFDPSLSDEERAGLFASLFDSVETDEIKEAARAAAKTPLPSHEKQTEPQTEPHHRRHTHSPIRSVHSMPSAWSPARPKNVLGGSGLETRKFPHLRPVDVPKLKPTMPKDRVRMAEHLREAGHLTEAAEQYVDASREAMKAGESQRALLLIQQAITLLEEMPESPVRSLLEARALLELGRLQWLGTFPEATFSLQQALASMDAAEAALPFDAPPEMVGEIASLKAGVSCDLGEAKVLERSLRELTQISRQLLAEGQPLQAARLLNEQAAVYIRLGDPVQATHLLYRSRGLFDDILAKEPNHSTAQEESADTEHLLARLALHVPLRPGREEEAIAMSLQHARNAERWYAAQRRFHALGRVWGTMGRLELKRGRLEAAQQRLIQSLELQQQSGDLTGMARTHDALAQLFLLQGNEIEAVRVLGASIALNFEKGAPLGVAFNRRAFDQLLQHLQTQRITPTTALQQQIQQTEALLLEAERMLGRVALPRTIGV